MESMIGLESQNLLENSEAQDLPVVHVGARTPARHEFAVLRPDIGLNHSVVEGCVDGRYDVFQIHEGARLRHGAFLQNALPMPYIGRIPPNL